MTGRYYIMHGRQAIRAPNQLTWARWFRMTDVRDRLLAEDQINKLYVITSFLGVDDKLFQTAVFGKDPAVEAAYYQTYSDALHGHRQLVATLKRS